VRYSNLVSMEVTRSVVSLIMEIFLSLSAYRNASFSVTLFH
jgi:hypothetical protein